MHQALSGGCAGVVLDLVTEALDAIAAGQDPRPGVCCALADAVGADAAGFLSPQLQVVVHPEPAQAVVEQLLRATGADRRIARLPVLPLGSATDAYVFVRADGFDPEDLVLLRRARDPAGAVERVYRRASPAPPPPVEIACPPPVTLTARELEVLRLLSEGLLARTIATRLAVSPRTVHHHLGSIYSKLGVCDRLSAVLRARGLGLLDGAPAGAPVTRPAVVSIS